jgi:hypothetical protein
MFPHLSASQQSGVTAAINAWIDSRLPGASEAGERALLTANHIG